MPWSAPLVGPGLCVDLRRGADLSWTLSFSDARARPFGLPAAHTQPVQVGGFVGDVRRGGSCNCETHTITPHGDGTHTEGVGHLLEERIPVLGAQLEALIPALLVTVTPARLDSVTDDVSGNHAPDDRVVDELSLQDAIAKAHAQDVPTRALVVRTQPARAPHGENPVYFSADAALYVRTQGFAHLLVDLPSLDRADDGGLLAAHRAFFDVPPRTTSLAGLPAECAMRTVTELCAIPAELPDGPYALNLQLAPIQADAVPSRPLLFPLVRAPLRFAPSPVSS